MASTPVVLPKGVWTQITTTDKDGSIKHRKGDTKVVYLESPSEPVGFDPTTPWMETTFKGEGWPYWGVDSADFVFAYAINGDAEITVSPKGV